jgi:hypothetical protein
MNQMFWYFWSSRRERKKLCLMYNMYHGHAPSYLCDLFPPLVRDVTNYPGAICVASSCNFSSLSLSVCEQLSHTSQEYTNKGLMKVK